MCGIVGYVGSRRAEDVLLEGLRRLEYRGYDSAGVASVHERDLKTVKAVGKVAMLADALSRTPLRGTIGIAHTRWATHGEPTDENAHPHVDCRGGIAVVHNGIIENYVSLKHELELRGHQFRSQTDTEVFAHLLEEHERTMSFSDAFLLHSVRSPERSVSLRSLFLNHEKFLLRGEGVRSRSVSVRGVTNFLWRRTHRRSSHTLAM